jgi:hypothetical protein
MPFSKINPGTTIDSAQPSARTIARDAQKRKRKSGKLSPTVSKDMANWQRQCRMESRKPLSEVFK